MRWALDNPKRFFRERSELERLEAEAEWLSTAWHISEFGLLAVDLDMTIHGRFFAGLMMYPESFPDSPPYICPRDKSERWSAHQYGEGGSLCLEWRADNWNPDVTGADIVRSAQKLLTTERHPEAPNTVPSAHRLTEGQRIRSAIRRFVPTAEILATWKALLMRSRTQLKAATVYHGDAAVTFETKIADAQGLLQDVADVPEGIDNPVQLLSVPCKGWIFRSDAFDYQQPVESAEALVQILAHAGFVTDDILVEDVGKYNVTTIVLLGAELSSLRVFQIISDHNLKLVKPEIVWPSPAGLRLAQESTQLARLRVGIVGLGSLGSKVAVSLARSGVRRFVLVDDDYLSPGNMVRHELSWAYVGAHKVSALRDALSLIASGVQVDARNIRLAGQESSVAAAGALSALSKCDLLVDATANPEVFLLLAPLAKRNKLSLCWGEIFAGGYGGMIARARPSHDPNPLAVRDAFHNHLAKLPEPPFKNADGYDGNTEQPFVSYDSDIGYVATSLVRLAIDTALSRNPSEFPYSVYLLGMRREWIFEQPFDTRPIHVYGEGWRGDDSAASDEDRRAVLEDLLGMCEGEQVADTRSST